MELAFIEMKNQLSFINKKTKEISFLKIEHITSYSNNKERETISFINMNDDGDLNTFKFQTNQVYLFYYSILKYIK